MNRILTKDKDKLTDIKIGLKWHLENTPPWDPFWSKIPKKYLELVEIIRQKPKPKKKKISLYKVKKKDRKKLLAAARRQRQF